MERAETLTKFDVPIVAADGTAYTATACARARRDDGLWEAWIEFAGNDPHKVVLATPRETTQPNLEAARYWASGLSHVFLEGALVRAFEAVLPRV